MDKQAYIDYLAATSEKVSPFISSLLDPYTDLDPKLQDILLHFPRRRLHRPLLKPALLRATYELCGGLEWERIIPICAAFELINISSYQANSAFDNKLGILTRAQKDSQFIASMITRELAASAVANTRTLEDAIRLRLHECLCEANRNIYIAQHWDLNILHVCDRARYSDSDVFLRLYIERCYFGSGIFTGLTAFAGGLLAAAPDEELEALRAFGTAYGTALHIINDIGDYVPLRSPHDGKEYQAPFADLENGRLTLPLWHLLNNANHSDAAFLNALLSEGHVSQESLLTLLELLHRYESITYSRNMARQHMRTAIKALAPFANRPAMAILAMMASVVRSNKYYHAWKYWTRTRAQNGARLLHG